MADSKVEDILELEDCILRDISEIVHHVKKDLITRCAIEIEKDPETALKKLLYGRTQTISIFKTIDTKESYSKEDVKTDIITHEDDDSDSDSEEESEEISDEDECEDESEDECEDESEDEYKKEKKIKYKKPKTTKGWFKEGQEIKSLEKSREYNIETHCQMRTAMGICTKPAKCPKEEGGDPVYCHSCMKTYKNHIRGEYPKSSIGYMGDITSPLVKSTNPMRYKDILTKRQPFNTYKYKPSRGETQDVKCAFAFLMRTYAITRLPVDWPRGHYTEQKDPITVCEESEIIDIKDHLRHKGWKPKE
jgi:hypothetical protein